MKRFLFVVSSLVSFAVVACGPGPTEKGPSGPEDQKDLTVGKSPNAGATTATPTNEANPDEQSEKERIRARIEKVEEEKRRLDAEMDGKSAPAAVDGPDPVAGKFTLAEATAGLAGAGALTATITTSQGTLSCKLLEDKAPNTVANFVGLARGLRPWKDTNGWVKKPIYDGTTFHRIIKGFMIQGGDPKGNGTGEPGYTIKDEIWAGAKHDRPGLLCMANRGPNTNGAQFFITDAKADHLDGNYTIFGDCSPASVVHAIANVPVVTEKPTTPVVIKKVEISRGAPGAAGAAGGGGGAAKPTTPTPPPAPTLKP